MDKKWKVIFTGFGMYNTAYFDNALDCDAFAQLMANDGRLCRVWADGLEITDKYITYITMEELLAR